MKELTPLAAWKLADLDTFLKSIGGFINITFNEGSWLVEIRFPVLDGSRVSCCAFSPTLIEALRGALNLAAAKIDAELGAKLPYLDF